MADADSSTGFTLSGFGISDLLFASTVAASTPSARWNALGAVSVAGAVVRGAQLTLVWENYALAQKDGGTQYAVKLSLARQQSGAARIAAQVIGALASIARVDRQPDRLLI